MTGGASSTLIRNISDAMLAGQREHLNKCEHGSAARYQQLQRERVLEQRISRAKVAAMDAFAALNGWKLGREFPPYKIGHRNSDPYDNEWTRHELFDHCRHFRADGKNVAILTQPYGHLVLDEWHQWAAGQGLELHAPPDPLASFHYPRSTLFLVLTARGGTVRWLPEQISGWAA